MWAKYQFLTDIWIPDHRNKVYIFTKTPCKRFTSNSFSVLLPLIIGGPGQILDRARDGLELILKYVLLVHRVPDPHLAYKFQITVKKA